MKALILTPWIGKGADDDPFRPLVADLFPMSWSDVTGQSADSIYPDPNLYAIEALCSQAVVDKIKSDSHFLVLWIDEQSPKPDEKPVAAAFTKFRADCAQLGVKQTDLETVLGSKASGRAWGDIGQALVSWLKLRSKTG